MREKVILVILILILTIINLILFKNFYNTNIENNNIKVQTNLII